MQASVNSGFTKAWLKSRPRCRHMYQQICNLFQVQLQQVHIRLVQTIMHRGCLTRIYLACTAIDKSLQSNPKNKIKNKKRECPCKNTVVYNCIFLLFSFISFKCVKRSFFETIIIKYPTFPAHIKNSE